MTLANGRHPLEGLARTEAVGRVLTKPGRRGRGREDAGPIRYLIVGFTDGPWSSRYWPTPFPWKDATRDAGRAPFVVVRRLDGGAYGEPVGSPKSVHVNYFGSLRAPGWELEPESVVTIGRVGTAVVVTTTPRGEIVLSGPGGSNPVPYDATADEIGRALAKLSGTGYACQDVPAGPTAPGEGDR